jgi:hypothetical protein
VRLGKKKAALAIAHKILVIVYHLLAAGTCYEEVRPISGIRDRRQESGNGLSKPWNALATR